jgi:Flp pilus assembly protein CpaB
MVVAIICGLAASYMTSKLLADRNERVEILVAKQHLNSWTQIKKPEDMFEVEERLKSDAPRNAVIKFDSLKDLVLIHNLNKGDPLVEDNLQSKEKANLDVIIPPGKRAVAVRTTAEVVAGGFVLPNTRVDVIHSMRRGEHESDSRVILQNILVRAVDTLASKPDDKLGIIPATVTLEVTPQQALVLARVKDTGVLTLALRPVGDTVEEDLNPPAAKPPEPKPEPKPIVIEKVVEKIVEKIVPAPEPPEQRQSLVVFNGEKWTKATFVTKNGATRTEFETGAESEGSAPPPAKAVRPVDKAGK